MSIGFYKLNNKVLEFDVNTEVDEIRFNHYLMRKENGQRLNTIDPLERGCFRLAKRTVSKDLKVSDSKAQRLINKFIELGIIEQIYKSKKKGISSVYGYTIELKSEPNCEPNCEPNSFSSCNTFKGVCEPNCEPNREPSKKELLKRIIKKKQTNNTKDVVVGTNSNNIITINNIEPFNLLLLDLNISLDDDRVKRNVDYTIEQSKLKSITNIESYLISAIKSDYCNSQKKYTGIKDYTSISGNQSLFEKFKVWLKNTTGKDVNDIETIGRDVRQGYVDRFYNALNNGTVYKRAYNDNDWQGDKFWYKTNPSKIKDKQGFIEYTDKLIINGEIEQPKGWLEFKKHHK